MDLCWQSNVSAFQYAVWVGHSFSSKEEASFNFMAAVNIYSDFEAPQNQSLLSFLKGFPGGASGKEPTCQCRRPNRPGFNLWVRKIHWRRKWQPTSMSLSGKSHRQRSLAGPSSWGHKELDTTEVT